MAYNSDNPFKFLEELKRRKVVRVAIAYAAAAFVLLELTDIIAEPLGLPHWTVSLVLILLCIGFAITIILSWIYDITPEGVQKTSTVVEHSEDQPTQRPGSATGWRIGTYVSVIIIISLVLLNIFSKRAASDIDKLEKTIAVLPFEILGQGDTLASLHDAIPIALILELQKIKGFVVRPRGSTLTYSETEMRSVDIGEQLNANFLIKGYVQEQDRNAVIDILLINASRDEVIWNASYEMETEDIFRIRREISKQVASSLQNNFTPEDKKITENTNAYLAFLSGLKYYWKDETEFDYIQAIRYFEKAVLLDSSFTQAYAKISICNSMMYHLNLDRTENRLLEARKAIEVAKKIDPNNPELIFADGVYSYINNDYNTALRKYIAAEGKVFNNAELNLYLGSLYRRQMKLTKAIEYFTHAAEDDPRNKLFHLELGETNTMLRNYVEAERSFDKYILLGGNFETALVDDVLLYLLWENGNIKSRKALEERLTILGEKKSIPTIHRTVQVEIIDRNYEDAITIVTTELSENLDHQFKYRPVSLYLAEIYHYQGNKELAAFYYDSTRIHLEKRILSSPEDSRLHSTLGIAYAGLGRKKEAIQAGLTGISLMPTEKDYYRGIFRLEDLARIYTMVGEYNLALEQLAQLLSMPSLVSVNLLQKDPVWKPLWDLPEFKQLIKKYSKN